MTLERAFIGFEYCSETEVTIILRRANKNGALDVLSVNVPVDWLRRTTESANTFLTLLDMNIVAKRKLT
jgi:hypothetical protein